MVSNLLTKLSENEVENVNLYYILRNKSKEQVSYKIAGIKIDPTISEFFKDNIEKFLEKKLEDNENNIEYMNYEPDIQIDRNIVLTIAKTEVDLVQEYLEKLDDLENMDDSKQIKQKNLWGYIVHFNDINLFMFKKFSSSNVILKAKGFMNALIQDGILNSVEEDLITFDQNIDCLLYEDNFLIFNKQNFEKVFDFFEKMYQIVQDNIADLATKGYIQETDQLFEHCKNDSRKIKRLKNILDSDLLDSIDKTKFNAINEKFELGLEFDEEGNIKVDKEKTWQILALLNDDYLNSDLTMTNYEAQGKIKK
jgi:hypothetical protein